MDALLKSQRHSIGERAAVSFLIYSTSFGLFNGFRYASTNSSIQKLNFRCFEHCKNSDNSSISNLYGSLSTVLCFLLVLKWGLISILTGNFWLRAAHFPWTVIWGGFFESEGESVFL